MSSTPSSRTPGVGLLGRVTGRAAGASARRPKTVILLWLVLVVGLVAAGSTAGMKSLSDAESGVGDSARADQQLVDAKISDPAVESVLIRSDDRATTAAVTADLIRRASKLRDTANVRGPRQVPALSTAGGKTQLVQVTLRGDPADAGDHVDGLTGAVAAARAAHPGATLQIAGPGTFDKVIDKVVEDDLRKAELISLPITLVILLVAFGALVAASVPLLLGVTSVAAAIGGLGLISQFAPLGDAATSLVVLIGLAVGVDYSLFYIRREREERKRGLGPDAALHATAATVGRAVAVSGLTVIVALAGLLVTGMPVFTSMALGTMLVVAIAILGSLTVLPAVLALLGDRIDSGRLPGARRRIARRAARPQRPGPWARIAGSVTRHPHAALLTTVFVLGALAVPALQLKTSDSANSLPAHTPVMVAQRAIESSFPGAPDNAQLVVHGSKLDGAGARERLTQFGERARKVTGGRGEVALRVAQDGRTALVSVPMPDHGQDRNDAVVKKLRADVAPTVERVQDGASVLVTGFAAQDMDVTNRFNETTPIVIGFVLVLALVLLLATFRSLPLALGVLGLNLLSVGATYGILTAIFQHTWAEKILDFTSNGTVTDWVPLNAFVILFGLSMDYTILVLERIREARANGRSPREAATEGVATTARTVTSAAVVMVAIFAIFPTLPLIEMKMLGIALAAGVLIDATIVRGVALPAVVTLLGDRGVRAPRRERRRAALQVAPDVR
jgi:RND superfamily putative drug exporter